MRTARVAIVALSIVGLTTSGFAGDLQTSIARAARAAAQEQAAPPKASGGRSAALWSGGGLVAVGMGMTLWGLLHTSDAKYVTPIDMSKTSDPKLVGAGMAVVAGGGALLFMGTRHPHAPSVAFGPQGVTVSKGVSW